MVKLFTTHDKIFPVAFADAMALLFSDNGRERRFMIAMREMLNVCAKHHLIHSDTMDDLSFPRKSSIPNPITPSAPPPEEILSPSSQPPG
jgi:hypothetical protein